MGFMFEIFPILFLLMFGLVFFTILSTLFRSWKQERKNDNSPRLTVEATVVAKRGNTTRHHHNGAGGHHYHTYNNTYYATFQFESGDRIELQMAGQEFGLIIEGDRGRLTFQGTRFLGFERM